MKLNCKPGDIARVVGCSNPHCATHAPLIGRIVKVGEADPLVGMLVWEHVWRIDPPIYPGTTLCEDSVLRPIGNPDGEDETLSWKEVPKVANKQHTT